MKKHLFLAPAYAATVAAWAVLVFWPLYIVLVTENPAWLGWMPLTFFAGIVTATGMVKYMVSFTKR